MDPLHDDLRYARRHNTSGVHHLGLLTEPGQGSLIVGQVVKTPLTSVNALWLGVSFDAFGQRFLVGVQQEVVHGDVSRRQTVMAGAQLVLYLPRPSGLTDGLEGLRAFDILADVVAGCRVFVPGAGWPSGAGASGFRKTGRAGEVSADLPEPPADPGGGEPV